MVSALESGSSGLGFGAWLGTLCCVLGQRHFTLTVLMGTGVMLRWTSITSRGEYKYSESLHATETGDKRRPDGPS